MTPSGRDLPSVSKKLHGAVINSLIGKSGLTRFHRPRAAENQGDAERAFQAACPATDRAPALADKILLRQSPSRGPLPSEGAQVVEVARRCWIHGWKFDVRGNCIDLPNTNPKEAELAVPL